jgi:cytochrome c-type biogenesis protein CcmH/NrfG
MAVICLGLGLLLGYLFRAAQLDSAPAQTAARSAQTGSIAGQGTTAPRAISRMPAGSQARSPHAGAMGGRAPSMADLKQMADTNAAPLLAKLKNDPQNTDLLDQVGATYHAAHQFKQAAVYYDKAVQIDPKNIALRTKLAISLYRSGDVDPAIAQLNQALSYDPKDANALFDLGMIRLQGKQDTKGALAAWRQLLKSNPQLSANRKAVVQKMIADAQSTAGDQHPVEGAQSK